MNKALSYLAILTIFLDNFVLTRSPFDVYYFYIIYILIIILYFISTKSVPINKNFLILILGICCISFIQTRFNNYPALPVVKQFISILISSVPFYIVLKLNEYDPKKVFKMYANVAVIICIIGIFQQLSFFLFNIDYKYGYKLTSIVSEPAHLAITLSPAFFIAINKLLFRKESELLSYRASVLIVITWFLTMSGVAMLGLMASIGILALNRFKILSFKLKVRNVFSTITIVLLSVLLLYFIYIKVEFIRYRVDDTWSTLNANKKEKLGNINLSTYTIYINYLITKESLTNHPLLGSGIGTHNLNYDRYIDKVYNFDTQDYRQFEFNKDDANSLFLRLLSELGVFGLALFSVFLIKYNINKIPTFKPDIILDLWLINNGCLLFFIMRLIRFGNYSLLGFFLFAFIYYYSFRESKSSMI